MAVVDLVGSEQTARLALEVLANGGTFVGRFGGQLNVPWTMLNMRQLPVRGSLVGNPQALRELVDHFRAGRSRPIPIRGESIEKVNEGLAALRAGRVQGRLVHLLAPNRAFWKKG